MKKYTFFFLLAAALFPAASSAQFSRKEADLMIYRYARDEAREFDWPQTNNQIRSTDGSTTVHTGVEIGADVGLNFTLNYPCWSYFIDEWTDVNCVCHGLYLFVSESNGNLLTVRVEGEIEHEDRDDGWESVLYSIASEAGKGVVNNAQGKGCGESRSTSRLVPPLFGEANELVFDYIDKNIQGDYCLYRNKIVPDDSHEAITINMGIDLGDGKNVSFSPGYPCWVYVIDEYPDNDAPHPMTYLFVSGGNKNLREVRTKDDTGPSDLSDWLPVRQTDFGHITVVSEGCSGMIASAVPVHAIETAAGEKYIIAGSYLDAVQSKTIDGFIVDGVEYKEGDRVAITSSQVQKEAGFECGTIALGTIKKAGLQYFLPRNNAYISVADQRYHFRGDTIINDMRYTKIYEQHCSSATDCPDDDLYYYAAVREDTVNGRIYCRFEHIYGQDTEKKDVLLADFSVKAGDKVPIVKATMWEHNDDASYNVEVERVDYMLIDGEYRKRIKVASDYPSHLPDNYWVEGIGSIAHGLLFPSIAVLYADGGAPPFLLCMYENNRLTYKNPDKHYGQEDDCYMSHAGWIGADKTIAIDFNIYPNPVKETLYIETSETNVFYEIYDAGGSLVKAGNVNEKTISVAELLPATYLITLSRNDARLYSGRFVKE